ncbi:2997_t:CDS:2 [Funneliformis caledonium]|uniref:2997_t:CDS:1 n=1 Tax=Funneliformis caledonium TaxID=1117310 RepID=A0A9N9EV88_9GLOM|nr:2997_t:CDS:2 [Funneliformis caledonium]
MPRCSLARQRFYASTLGNSRRFLHSEKPSQHSVAGLGIEKTFSTLSCQINYQDGFHHTSALSILARHPRLSEKDVY